MKLLSIIFFIWPFIFLNILTAQNLTNQEKLEFYPHHISDNWFYWWEYYDPIRDFGEGGIAKLMIPQDTVINDITYWLMEMDSFSGHENYLERIDTVSGNVLRIDFDENQIDCVDNVYADVGDTISISNNKYLLNCDKLAVLSFSDTMINNMPTTVRKVIGLPGRYPLYFARNIGMLGSGENFWMDSAYVNGVSYAYITDIKDETVAAISTFVLYQNYPNPFNPVTTIEYSLPKSAFITIKIYDFLGREIKTLVNEEKSRGSHSVKFNGDNFASGIYFYQLQMGKEFTDTKKMILLK